MRKLLPVLILVTIGYLALDETELSDRVFDQPGDAELTLAEAYKNRQSDLQVRGSGQVVRILADDNDGSRHQRFILRVSAEQTILIAHNIDLAPRIPNLEEGDDVHFFGEYEWNDRGGVIHWTHHDPQGRHVGGWLKHQGKTYQ